MKNISFLFLLSTCAISCINFKFDSDASSDLSGNDTKNIYKFNLMEVGKSTSISNASEINFQEINSEQLKQAILVNKKTWVYVWGSWCTPCRKKLPLISQLCRDNPDWNIILVADDYNIKSLQNLLFENKIFIQPYILDYKTFGQKIHEKEKILWEKLKIDQPFSDGVPQNYLFDKQGNLVYYGSGNIPEHVMKNNFITNTQEKNQ